MRVLNLTWIFSSNAYSVSGFAHRPAFVSRGGDDLRKWLTKNQNTTPSNGGNNKNSNKWKPFFWSEMRRSLHEGHNIYVRRVYRTCARYIHTFFLFFSSLSPSPLYRIPAVIVRLLESIEGIARLMMSISRATGPGRGRGGEQHGP